MSSDLESNIVAVERVKEYSETKAEVRYAVQCVRTGCVQFCFFVTSPKLELDCACVSLQK